MYQLIQHLQILWVLEPQIYFFCLIMGLIFTVTITAAIGLGTGTLIEQGTVRVSMLGIVTIFVTTFFATFGSTLSETGKYATITNPKAYIAEVTTTIEGEPILRIKIDPQVTQKTEQLLGNSLKVIEKEREKTADLSIGEAKRLTSLGLNIRCKPGLEEKVTLALSQK